MPLSLLLLLWNQDLLGREVSLTQWQVDGEDATLHIFTVCSLDGAMMHLNHHLTEVQTNTCTLDMKGMRSTIEAVEEPIGIAFDAHTRINNLQNSSIPLAFCHAHLNGSTVIGVFEGIRQQVIYDLIKRTAVEPHIQLVNSGLIMEINVALLSCVVIRLQDITYILYHIRLLTLQLHLLLINLTDVQNLIHQVLNALGIMLDGLQLCLCLLIKVTAQQFVQRTHDQCER